MRKNVIDNTDDLDLCYSRLKSEFLALHLQLAEESKGSSEFKTTYKNESGKEIEVTRSPDGKFASKGGGGGAASSELKESEGKESKNTNTTKIAKDVFSGETGDRVKDNLVATATDPDIKIGIRKAKFSEILGGLQDAMSNASDYIDKKIEESRNKTLKQPLGVILGEVLVGSFVLASLAGAAAVVAGAIAPVRVGIAVSINYLGLRAADSAVVEKIKLDKAEELKKQQELINEARMMDSVQKLIKEKEARQKLYDAVDNLDITELKPGKKTTLYDDGKGTKFSITAQ